MPTLNDLGEKTREHWELHLGVAMKYASSRKEAEAMLKGGELPGIKHPSHIHDWIEKPEERGEIEARDG